MKYFDTTQAEGFSLIELMVVLAILSLLSCIAYPSYTRYQMQVKRLKARLALLEASVCLEKYAAMSDQGYLGATLQGLGLQEITEQGSYQFSIQDLDREHYTLIAQPTFKDKYCTQLSCTSEGKYYYKGEGSYDECWGN